MSLYPTEQRCPRCQYPITPGAQTCPNCGLALTSAPQSPYGADVPPPPSYPAPSVPASPYGPPPGTAPSYGSGSYGAATSYDYTPQPPPPPPVVGPTSYYPNNQPQPGFGGSAPAYAGSQPQPGLPFPPGSQPPQQQKTGGGMKVALIVLVVLIILGGGGAAAIYLLTRPKPAITVTSNYKVGSTPAGATGTELDVTGQKFSGSSNVSFLLDGQPAPDNQTTLSDSNGNIKATLKITSNWGVGQHVLTAKDAGNYKTDQGITISIVNPGEAKTPGPNGAPSDDASFKVAVHIRTADGSTFTDNVTVTGTADAGKQVCNPEFDDGAPHTSSGDASGLTYVETLIYSCSGTYKGGKLSYTEQATKDQIVFSNGVTCTAQVPYVFEKLDGTFTAAKTLTGDYSADAVTYSCSSGDSDQIDPTTGTWTGDLA
jgi:hypothetical protein